MYTIALFILSAALLFVWSHNPVHGVLTLVLVGLGFSGYLLNSGLEFTAFVVVLVYVGAVTILFIFVVRRVNLRATSNSFILAESPRVWFILGGLLLSPFVDTSHKAYLITFNQSHLGNKLNLTELGHLFYGTDRLLLVLFVGGVLFVAMIAAICLSLVSSENYRTQEFYTQIRRNNSLFGFQK